MPLITLEVGEITKEQKAALVKELVSKSSEILNIPEQAFMTIIKENNFDNIGSGTALLSDAMKNRK